jgi:hypothetical protein
VRRLGGAVACLAVGLVGLVVPALAVSALLVAVLVGLIALERIAEARREARGAPSPLERVEATAASSEP